ncbi:hypothetical protein BGW80DRAFT_1316620 [Lactifluus volemus]|nr:hypothetical protein BGW80DRAFT_1316620 [Lactifluus volemus]
MAADPADKPAPHWRTRTSSVLTTLAHGSVPFITTFLLVHLSAPAAANLGVPFSNAFSPPHPPRPLSSALSVTGYATAFIFLPIHILTHRLAPADLAPPIASLSPSELDYEYVKAALRGWPVRSKVLYAALVVGVALHAADGFGIIWSTWIPNLETPGRRARRALACAAVIPILTDLAVLAREPLFTLVSTAARSRAALTQSFVYRL